MLRTFFQRVVDVGDLRIQWRQRCRGEARGDLYYTKPMLLAIGDRYEDQLAADRAEDARYR